MAPRPTPQAGLATISADGSNVAFASAATNLVSGDTNNQMDIFVRPVAGGSTVRVNLGSGGAQANGHSNGPSISADGSYVAFYSDASNLVSSDTNGASDIFVCPRTGANCTRVSVNSSGQQGNYGSYYPSLSGDGQTVLFESGATNLVSGDTNNQGDIFTHSLVTRSTQRVSLAADGSQANQTCSQSALSLDGRFAAFSSTASNLVPNDTNGYADVFVTDAGGSGDPWLLGIAFGNYPYAREEGDPVVTSTGNATASATDLSLPGLGLPLVFARTYNSQDAGTTGPLGYGWNHSYSARLLFPSSSVVTVE
jgi:Tol biopolymer transport system component